jgi:hypothetical protein
MKAVLLFAGLVACAPAPPAEKPATRGTCSIDGLKDVIGKPYSAEVAERARTASGSKLVRIIRPGMAVTMDYRIDRLNIDLDAKNVVTGLHCG